MISDDKWQGYFGDMFEGREVPPEDRLWKNIASRIPDQGGPKRPGGFWWYFPIAVVLIGLIGWSAYELLTENKTGEIVLASVSKKNNFEISGTVGNSTNSDKDKRTASIESLAKSGVGSNQAKRSINQPEFIKKANASGEQASESESAKLPVNDNVKPAKVSKSQGQAGILNGEINSGETGLDLQLKPQKPNKTPRGNIRDRHNLGRTLLLAGPIIQHGGRGKDGDNQDKPKNLQGLALRTSKHVKSSELFAQANNEVKGIDETSTDSPYRSSGILEPMLIPILETKVINSVKSEGAKLAVADSTLPNPKGLIDSLVSEAKAKNRTTLYGFQAAGHQMMQTTYIRGFESIHISEGHNPSNSAMQTFSLGLTAIRRVAPKTDVRVRFDYFRLQQAFSGGANSTDASNFTTSWLSADSFGVQPLYQKGTYSVTKTYHLGLFSMGVQQWLYNGFYVAADAGIGYNLGSRVREEHRGYKGNASPLQPGSSNNNFGMIRLGVGYRRNLGKGWMMQMEPAIQWFPKIGGLKGDLDFKSRSVGVGITFLR